jgi:DNA processing protein
MPFTLTETKAALIFTHAPFLGPKKIMALLSEFGSFLNMLEAFQRQITLPVPLRKETFEYLAAYEKMTGWQLDFKKAENEGVSLFPYTSTHYPLKLKAIEDPPALLYCKGTLPQVDVPWIAVVGTRGATVQAIEETKRFALAFQQAGCVVVSGLARGVDTAAHRASLKRTVAVVGSGFLHLYPEENKPLACEICKSGALLSEFAMEQQPTHYTFPKRNRIISALADAVLLAEAPEKSGAMITMKEGQKQGKPLFALPGRAGKDYSCGNNLLIKTKVATLVDHPEEILQQIGKKQTSFAPQHAQIPTKNIQKFSENEQKIIALLQRSEYSLEELVSALLLPVACLQKELMQLVLKKIILELPGKRYTLVHS